MTETNSCTVTRLVMKIKKPESPFRDELLKMKLRDAFGYTAADEDGNYIFVAGLTLGDKIMWLTNYLLYKEIPFFLTSVNCREGTAWIRQAKGRKAPSLTGEQKGGR